MKLYNSYTKQIEDFKPLNDKEVKMYVCGITPYDTTHLGHAFTYTAFDILYRFLKFQDYTINYTQNVTDIDDDILKRAKRDGRDWKELGQFWTDKYVGDMRTMNNVAPTHYVKATETIETILEIIKKLVADDMAYEAEGNVYFRTKKVPEYGALSHYNRDQMLLLSKERGANPDDPRKEDPLDFIMWQKSLPEEPSWESPWSPGRPGWHIECSAMIYKYLYKNIDIHGGGRDLIYPHHESEIAQSESFTGVKPFSKFWMHTGAVMFEGEKMSKSLGNLVMVSELLKTYTPNAIRYLLLSHHYRNPWEYQQDELDAAQMTMNEIEKEIRQTDDQLEIFKEALADDLDTKKALEIFTKTKSAKMAEVLGFKL